MLDQNPRMQRHVIDALLCLVLDHVQQIIGGELLELLVPLAIRSALHRLVNGNRSDWYRRRGNDRATNAVDVSTGRQIHHSIRAVLDGDFELLDFAVRIGRHLRVADVGVDFHPGDFTDRHRLQRAGQVVDVGGDDQPPDRDLVAHRLRCQLLALGDEAHRVGDLAATRGVHLRACYPFHFRLPTPVLTGSGSEGLSQPRVAAGPGSKTSRAAPLSVVESNGVGGGKRLTCN